MSGGGRGRELRGGRVEWVELGGSGAGEGEGAGAGMAGWVMVVGSLIQTRHDHDPACPQGAAGEYGAGEGPGDMA